MRHFLGCKSITIAGIQGKYDLQTRTVTTDALLPITFVTTIFKRKGKFSSIFCKMESPKHMEHYLYFEDTIFGAKNGSSILFGIGKDVFQYNIRDGSWLSVQDYKDVKFERTEAMSCAIGDEVLICGGVENPNGVEFIKYSMNVTNGSTWITNGCFNLGRLGPQKFCDEKLPVPCHFGHSLTNIGNNRVLLIGGADESVDDNAWGNSWDGSDYLEGRASNRVYIGRYCNGNITWREVGSMKYCRCRHTTFQIDSSVYVFGGNDTREYETFDVIDEKWCKSHLERLHRLPFNICCIPHSAIVCKNESMAILLCNHFWKSVLLHVYSTKNIHNDRVNLNIFTEDKGFQSIKLPITVKYGCDAYKLSQYVDMKTFRHFISIQF